MEFANDKVTQKSDEYPWHAPQNTIKAEKTPSTHNNIYKKAL